MTPAAFQAPTSSNSLPQWYDDLPSNFNLESFRLFRRVLAEQSPLHFGLTYLPHYLTNQVPKFHQEIVQALESPRLVVVAPREHAKSTLINVVTTLYELYTQKFRYQLFVGDTSSQAQGNLAAVIREIENNRELREDYGNLKPTNVARDKWTNSAIVTTTGIKIEALGVGGKIRGRRHLQFRPDRIVCDDIENDENVATKEQRQKLESWFFSALLSALDKDRGRLRVIGTILHFDSLLAKLVDLRLHPAWRKLRYQAVNFGADGNPAPLWPARWDLGSLAARKAETGSVIFEQEFQNNPVADEAAIIKRAWIKSHHGYTPEQVKEWKKVIYVDPAAKDKDSSDEFALAVVGVDANQQLYSLDSWHGKLSFREQVATIGRYTNKWKDGLGFVAVETVAYQEALRQEVDDWSRETAAYIPIKGVATTKDKTLRLTAQSGAVEGGFVLFGPQDQDLIDQLCNWGKTRYDDLADAFIGALEQIRSITPGFLSFIKEQAQGAKKDPVQSFMATYGRRLI